MEDVSLTNSRSGLRQLLGVARGRPLAIIVLLVIVIAETLHALPKPVQERYPAWLSETVAVLHSPLESAQAALFDSYQQFSPREPQSQPVTVVAIDEKSLQKFGQWPWPRDVLAKLVNTLDFYEPDAIGLDFYMPEPDQNSIEKLASRLAPEQTYLLDELNALPSSDFQLSMALSSTRSVLAAAGFGFSTYTTTDQLFSIPVSTQGEDPLPFVTNYPQVLASLPELQQAAAGQALLSVPGTARPVRKLALIMAVNGELVPTLALEMLRVATYSEAIEVASSRTGVDEVRVADLAIKPQHNTDVWLHYAPIATTGARYLSASDLFSGNFDPVMLENKLVLIGLTGAGLSDMRFTSLGEQVPGVEIHAQLVESLFDGALLKRPGWMPWVEILMIASAGLLLIWFAPRPESWVGAVLKFHPALSFGAVLAFAGLMMGLGYFAFWSWGILFSATSVVIGSSLVLGIFIINTLLDNLGEAQARLARLVQNGIALARVHDRDALLEMTLDGVDEITPCEASVILLKSEDNKLSAVHQRGLQAEWEEVIDLQAASEQSGVLGRAFTAAGLIQLSPGDTELMTARWSGLTTRSGKSVRSLLVVPMLLSDKTVWGVVVLINALDPISGDVVNFDPKNEHFVDALATQTAVVIENQDLVEAQEKMLDAMIKMVAGAIDAKSPYTGGHCERVPELAIMLCRAANQTREGALADFALTTEDEWREFTIAAWLHDCGKVTTPEHVVDKATKLETIYNRIHEVRTRFEVLLRDARIERLQAIHERGVEPEEADRVFAARKQQLLDDFAFLAKCNEGGEFLEQDKIDRIHAIGSQTWTRHFDNCLGLSEDERKRLGNQEEQRLPVTEPLLSDRPEHLVERPPTAALDEKFGFKMEIPEYLYNHGELHNLVISRGTLTAEERFKINEHIIQTIFILEQMPFPPNLSRIPEIAGGHHETLIGTGYPRKLTRDELSIPARIMAIADIFEALTASDRPYKKAKTLSESIRILSFFKKDQHIDPDLFDLFLTSGIYKQYAERFLSEDQIDEVDISQYLG
ncbi:CHASE2 domain-containing protein [Marinobacterium stanieri]|uniref:CHASE2 domain-containing protein n=1 Tax=Marinobacterium stanieri TaxID=49186 RepID=UPI0002559E5F|nr:CHASE2 domain-containing protein [Marinobacterium stanieri]